MRQTGEQRQQSSTGAAKSEGYNVLHNNSFTRIVMTGVVRSTGASGAELKPYRRPLHEVESLYITNTDGLIGTLDGSITENRSGVGDTPFMVSGFDGEPAKMAIYLDKSARPIRRLVHNLWGYLAKDSTEEPQAFFLNVDKEIWLTRMGFPTSVVQDVDPSKVDIDSINPQTLYNHLTRLRALFVNKAIAGKIHEDDLESVWNLPTIFDGQNVAIIDEVRSSGNTLRIAMQIMTRAFPKARFSSTYWATPTLIRWSYIKDEKVHNSFCASYVPVWYDSESAAGRGIDDIDPTYSAKSPSAAQRIGSFILSTPYHRPDTRETFRDISSQRVAEDLDLLSNRFKDGKIFFRPSPSRNNEEFREKACRLNGNISFEEYKKRLNQKKN